ncbi:hypothetical protein CERZMDRAFT_103642 [Cercospora zeae-maydis SCOH1-5]|uniref:Uncharacterized protein n=1 Tax=Cercospora zeae-maydis SCOH1-5 TaxID=717836 RepID=A0A6A6EYM1_9PEZI|nr:hypothetical protein CERZMDRAFT_103642 [Cercospora zeae-maydis SCOH1-5]
MDRWASKGWLRDVPNRKPQNQTANDNEDDEEEDEAVYAKFEVVGGTDYPGLIHDIINKLNDNENEDEDSDIKQTLVHVSDQGKDGLQDAGLRLQNVSTVPGDLVLMH